MALPAFAVPLASPLSIASLVLIDAPGAWRGVRIPLDAKQRLAAHVPARGFLTIGGGDADIALPGIASFMMIETREGEFVCDAPGTYSRDAAAREPLPPYATIHLPPYTLMFVPPTPDGLGIPPDYAALTLARTHKVDAPCLLVRAGHRLVLGRKLALRQPCLTVGGSLQTDVPLFRLAVEIAARLTRGVGELSYFVEPVRSACAVSVEGAYGDRKILTSFAVLRVAEWELVLLPPGAVGRKPAAG